jgi:PST family polysaccharide transporter
MATVRLGKLLSQVYVLHGLSTGIGLLTVPLTAWGLGTEGFGQLAYGMAVAALLAPVVELGLDLWLARGAAYAPASALTAQSYAASVALRATVVAVAFATLCVTAQFSARVHHQLPVVGLFLLTLVPQVLGLQALVQARTDYQADAAWLLVSRVLYAGALLALLPLHPAPTLVAALAAAAAAVHWVPMHRRTRRAAGLRWAWPRWRDVLAVMRTGWPLTLSRAITVSYAHSPVLLVGALHGASAAGVYALAERFMRAAQQLLYPLAQLTLSAQLRPGTLPSTHLARMQLALGAALSLALAAAAVLVLPRAFPQFGPQAQTTLLLLAPVVLLASASHWWGIGTLGARGRYRALFLCVALAAVVYWALAGVLSGAYGAVGMAMAVLATELTATAATRWQATRIHLEERTA